MICFFGGAENWIKNDMSSKNRLLWHNWENFNSESDIMDYNRLKRYATTKISDYFSSWVVVFISLRSLLFP